MTHITRGAVVLAASVVLLAGCSENSASKSPTSSTATSASAASGAETITTQLKTADGKPVADATFDWSNGSATVTIQTVAGGILSPGFHGLHIHSVGKCEANSVAPSGGAPGDFNSAGGHLQVPGHTSHPASGELTSLEVRSDGSAKLVTTTDAFTKADLSGPEGSALIIHEGSDNFANIPPRYSAEGKPGPDEKTMATGDAGKRVACAVIAPASVSGSPTSTGTAAATSTPTSAEASGSGTVPTPTISAPSTPMPSTPTPATPTP